jgi:hypothetical protein
MAKPNYTVIVNIQGEFQILPVSAVPFEVKGTSLFKSSAIKKELDNA